MGTGIVGTMTSNQAPRATDRGAAIDNTNNGGAAPASPAVFQLTDLADAAALLFAVAAIAAWGCL